MDWKYKRLLVGISLFLTTTYLIFNEDSYVDMFYKKVSQELDIPHAFTNKDKKNINNLKEKGNLKYFTQENLMMPNMGNICDTRQIISDLHSTNNTGLASIGNIITRLSRCEKVYYPSNPKCASRTVKSVAKNASLQNHFRLWDYAKHLYFDFDNENQELTLMKQLYEVPGKILYTNEIHYTNFTRLNLPVPIFINVVRDPIEWLVSLYYFRIFGSSTSGNRPKQLLNKPCHNVTLDNLVLRFGSSLTTDVTWLKYLGEKQHTRRSHKCWPPFSSQLVYFCDSIKQCRMAGPHRLKAALRAVEKDYLLVGLSHDLVSFVQILEVLMPHFFKGSTEIFRRKKIGSTKDTKTHNKKTVTKKTQAFLRTILKDDYVFYKFVQQRFFNIKQNVLGES